MAVVTMKQLLESGVHFGHATRRWNPKMQEYIFTSRNGIHIIDLKKTSDKIEEAYKAMFEIVANGGKVLFVGTKKQAQQAVKEEAKRTGHYYVDQRWLGGTLTNFQTIRRRIKRLHDLYKMEEEGIFEKLPKKEVLTLTREREKLEKFLGGIKDMPKLPQAIYLVDPNKERNALLEAKKLGIPVFAMVDTNCDPDDVDYIIPSNDDAIRAVNLITGIMGNAIIEAQGGVVEKYEEEKRPAREERRAPREEKKVAPKAKKEEAKETVKPQVKKEEVKEVKKTAAPKKAKTKKSEYEKLTVVELKDIAREREIVGFSTLRKAELIKLIMDNEK